MIKKLIRTLSEKRVVVLFSLVAVGIIFILLSEYTPKEKTASDPVFDDAEYTKALEEKLEKLITQVDGISDVNVMITLESSPRYLYETNPGESIKTGSDLAESVYTYGQADTGKNEAVLTSVTAPEIKGVSVVCKGAADAVLRQKVIGLIAGALNLGVNRIFVTE